MTEEEAPKKKRKKRCMPSGWRPKHRKGYKYPRKKRGPTAEDLYPVSYDPTNGALKFVRSVVKKLRDVIKDIEANRLDALKTAVEYAKKNDAILCRTYLQDANRLYEKEREIDKRIQALTLRTSTDSDIYALVRQLSMEASKRANHYLYDLEKNVLPLIISKADEMLPEHAVEYAEMIQRDLDNYEFEYGLHSFLTYVLRKDESISEQFSE